jgi:hypothetical protein
MPNDPRKERKCIVEKPDGKRPLGRQACMVILHKVLGRTKCLLFFDMTQTTRKMEKSGEDTQQGDLISLKSYGVGIHRKQGDLICLLQFFSPQK